MITLGAMPKETWIFAGLFSALLVAGLVTLVMKQRGTELDRVRAELVAAQALVSSNTTHIAKLENDLAETKATAEQLAEDKEAATQAQKSIEAEMRQALQSKDVTISELQGKLTVNILDRVLFDSGDTAIRPEGQQVMQQVANVLAQYPNRQIHVIGHTDNVPIRATAWSKYPTNWELSTARATAAVRFLQEHAGVDARRLGAVGYGEFHPIADNSTAEGRAKNRRIAIVVLPEELAGTEPVKPDASLAVPVEAAAITNTVPELVPAAQ